MASIVYVCDLHMIEYHRLNGHNTINFWRLSQNRRFTDFHEQDYLFFLVKGTEKADTREKGILGYGHLQNVSSMSINQMWNTYQTRNGYGSKKALTQAIAKANKNEKLPNKLDCLYLTDVIFFQAPIYLSEIGINISNKVESYFYLDKEDDQATAKLLQKADELGVDIWSRMLNDNIDDDLIKNENIRHDIVKIMAKNRLDLNQNQRRRAKHYMEEVLNDDPSLSIANGNYYEAYDVKDNICTIVLCVTRHINIDQLMIGHAIVLKDKISHLYPNMQINFECIGDGDCQKVLNAVKGSRD